MAISDDEAVVLLALRFAPEGTTAEDLADMLGADAGRVVAMLAGMVEEGLVRATPVPCLQRVGHS